MAQPLHHRQRGYTVHFSNRSHEYPVFKEDPPVVVQGRYEPPPAPVIQSLSLPDTPGSGVLVLGEDASGERDQDYHFQFLSSTPANSPANIPSRGLHNSTQATTPSHLPRSKRSPSPSLPSSPDVCSRLQRFPIPWLVRGQRLVELPRTTRLNTPAFASRRDLCVLCFRGENEGDEWESTVRSHSKGRPLTIEDILVHIDEELYKPLTASDMYPAHPQYEDACRERPLRVYGEEDTSAGVFRNIDLFSGSQHRYFVGLSEMPPAEDGASRYLVRLAPHASD